MLKLQDIQSTVLQGICSVVPIKYQYKHVLSSTYDTFPPHSILVLLRLDGFFRNIWLCSLSKVMEFIATFFWYFGVQTNNLFQSRKKNRSVISQSYVSTSKKMNNISLEKNRLLKLFILVTEKIKFLIDSCIWRLFFKNHFSFIIWETVLCSG